MTFSATRLGFDLRILETFVVVGRELSYRRAAEILYVSQPAVSQQIKKLERQLGFTLLDRSSSGVRLTAEGTELLRAAERALGDLRDTLRPIQMALRPSESRIRIGYITTWARTEIPKLMAMVERDSPELKVVLESYVFDDLLHAIRNQMIDLAIFHLPDVLDLDTSALHLMRVGSTQRFVAVRADHPLAARESVDLTELAGQAWVGATGLYAENFVALCVKHGFTPNIVVSAANAETMLGLVRAGLGVTVVPNQPPGWDDLAFVPIEDEVLDIVVAQHRDAPHPFTRPLIGLIRSTFAATTIPRTETG
ncbi:LysR family transcriptional regulator [Sinosporangium siamense]|uniref:LysR family transcriptional regulator n=1 Tax=Sinosporangium siamense TaxID=1367973 RepID=A0A919RMJ8_9ACTN|nr:LysR family transcriptional regulator [Sinosporangium siamense]GII96535.1 LysR family transcriptional regulator [Sinosporangium siamense]